MITISTDKFYAMYQSLELAACHEKYRTHLHQVRIERKDNVTTLVTTDGHRMHLWREALDLGEDCAYSVPLDVFSKAAKAAKGLKGSSVTLESSTITLPGTTFTYLEAEGFPAYQQVIPSYTFEDTGRTRGDFAINAEYLADACKAMAIAHKASGGNTSHKTRILAQKATDPILLADPACPVSCVVMPMRD